MIVFYLICLGLILGLLQFFLGDRQMQGLTYDYSYDTDLAEPEETITMTSTVRNRGKLPVFYAGLSEYITDDLTIRDRSSGKQRISARFGEKRVNRTFWLPAHRQVHFDLRFYAERRGVYHPGKYVMETGDFLGLKTSSRSGNLDRRIVIMPECSRDQSAMAALGGYLGDISVRRYLFEDPVLTVGTRDYTGREPMKAISWNQTARTGILQAKVYDHTVEANASVILNMDGGSTEELEECLRLTRSACEYLEKNRIPYDFYTNGDIRTPYEDLSWLAPGLGKRHLNAILHGLGASKLLRLTTFSSLVDRCMEHRKVNNSFIVITAPMDDAKKADLERLRSFSEYDLCVLSAHNQEGGENP